MPLLRRITCSDSCRMSHSGMLPSVWAKYTAATLSDPFQEVRPPWNLLRILATGMPLQSSYFADTGSCTLIASPLNLLPVFFSRSLICPLICETSHWLGFSFSLGAINAGSLYGR